MTALLVGLALVVAAPAAKEPPKKDAPTLVGEWVGETGVRGGKPENPPPGTSHTFAADGTVTFKEGGESKAETGTYKADAKKTPAEIDLEPPMGKGQVMLGIYKIEGDTLTICIAMGKDRPTKFDAPAGSEVMLVTCKRVKKD